MNITKELKEAALLSGMHHSLEGYGLTIYELSRSAPRSPFFIRAFILFYRRPQLHIAAARQTGSRLQIIAGFARVQPLFVDCLRGFDICIQKLDVMMKLLQIGLLIHLPQQAF